MNDIPFLKPNLVKAQSYQKYLAKIDANRIYSNYGPLCLEFESKVLSDWFGSIGKFLFLNNGTSALMLAISQSQRSQGRYALMPSFTFPATALAAMWCGLEPYFIDIDEHEWAMDTAAVGRIIEELGEEVAVVVPYATFGSAIDLTFYNNLIAERIPVVVDAAASFGTIWNDVHFGRGFNGPIVYSFHATKPFGIGEGGGVYSANEDLIDRIRQASNFGFDESRECRLFGLNAKASEYSAAIGLATLEAFPDKVARRLEVLDCYKSLFSESGLSRKGWSLHESRGIVPYQHFPILAPDGSDSTALKTYLADQGIGVRNYFNPSCHSQEFFKNHPRKDLQTTEAVMRRVISLPLWEEMSLDQIEYVISFIARY